MLLELLCNWTKHPVIPEKFEMLAYLSKGNYTVFVHNGLDGLVGMPITSNFNWSHKG